MYVVSIVAYQEYQDRCRPHKRIFTHVGPSAHAHNIGQEVEVHGWLLSGIEELTILCCSFLTLVANSKRFGARLSHSRLINCSKQ